VGDHADARFCGHQTGQDVGAGVGAGVIHEQQLPGKTQLVQDRRQFGYQRFEVVLFVEGGDYHR